VDSVVNREDREILNSKFQVDQGDLNPDLILLLGALLNVGAGGVKSEASDLCLHL